MIVLAFRLVWALARLLVQLSWLSGALAGHVLIAIARCVAAHRSRRRAIAFERGVDER